MYTAQQAFDLLVSHKIIQPHQLYKNTDLESGQLVLRSVTEPQCKKIQSFLGCKIISKKLADNTIDSNYHSFSDFLYEHKEGDKHPYSLRVEFKIHTPRSGSFNKVTLNYFNENVLVSKGIAFTQTHILSRLAIEGLDENVQGFFLRKPYRVNREIMEIMDGFEDTNEDEVVAQFDEQELIAEKDTGKFDGFRFYIVPNVMMLEIVRIKAISTEKADLYGDCLDNTYHNTLDEEIAA